MRSIRFAVILAIFLIALLAASTMAHAAPVSSSSGGVAKTIKAKFTGLTSGKIVTKQTQTNKSIDAIVLLPTSDLKKTKDVVNLIKKKGGIVSIVYVPNTIVVLKLPKNVENDLTIRYGAKILRDTQSVVGLKNIPQVAINLLNPKRQTAQTLQNVPFKDDVLTPIDAPIQSKAVPFSPPGSSGYPPPSSSTYTSYYMIGDVFVSVVLLESNGTIDSNLENWTITEENTADTQIADALNWWVNRSVDYNVSYSLTFWTYPSHNKVETSYEPTQRPRADQNLWIPEAMDALGAAPDSNYMTRVRTYDNALRSNNATDWAFTLFVTDYSDYGGSSWNPYSYLGGPYAVIKSPASLDAIAAHEMAHVFWAYDEYGGGSGCASSSDCTKKSGILQVENQNCQYSCAMNVNSLMRSGTISAGITNYTAGQIGWRDLNSNVVTDSIDYSYNSADNDTDSDGTIDYWDLDDDNDSISDISDSCPKSFGFPIDNGCSPPAVTVNANATSITTGEVIKITANATDNFKITSIDLYLDGANTSWSCTGLGTINANCSKELSYGAAGNHTFHAIAKDDNNETRDPTSGEKFFNVTAIIITNPAQVTGTAHTFSNFKNVLLTWNTATAGTYPISYYNIYRGGSKIGTSLTTNYTDTTTSEATQYKYQISAVDTLGNEGLKSTEESLYTGPLMIMSVTPKHAAANVSVNTTVTVVFNIPVNKTKAQANFNMYTQPAGPFVTGSFSWPNNTTLIFTPAAPLNPAAVFYSCEERGAPDGSRGVQTIDGLKLATKDYGVNVEIWNYIWSFSNGPYPP